MENIKKKLKPFSLIMNWVSLIFALLACFPYFFPFPIIIYYIMIWTFFTIQFIKLLILDGSIFKGQGIFSFSLLMLWSWMIFRTGVSDQHVYETRTLFGGWAFMLVWLGMFDFKRIIKPFNAILDSYSDTQPQYTPEQFNVVEDDTEMVVRRTKR